MTLEEFIPQNHLETLIVETKREAGPIGKILAELVASPVFVSSTTEAQPDASGFTPLLLGDPLAPLVAVFTSIERGSLHRERAQYGLQMTGRDFVLRLPEGYGIVLNPGYAAQLTLTPEGIAQLKERIG